MHCICRNRAHLSTLHRLMVDAGFSPSVIQRCICRIGSGAWTRSTTPRERSAAPALAAAAYAWSWPPRKLGRALPPRKHGAVGEVHHRAGGQGATIVQSQSSGEDRHCTSWGGCRHRASTKQGVPPPWHELGRAPPCVSLRMPLRSFLVFSMTGEGMGDAVALLSLFISHFSLW
jgi:hypothetical protein